MPDEPNPVPPLPIVPDLAAEIAAEIEKVKALVSQNAALTVKNTELAEKFRAAVDSLRAALQVQA